MVCLFISFFVCSILIIWMIEFYKMHFMCNFISVFSFEIAPSCIHFPAVLVCWGQQLRTTFWMLNKSGSDSKVVSKQNKGNQHKDPVKEEEKKNPFRRMHWGKKKNKPNSYIKLRINMFVLRKCVCCRNCLHFVVKIQWNRGQLCLSCFEFVYFSSACSAYTNSILVQLALFCMA